jgi:hypothetical protein
MLYSLAALSAFVATALAMPAASSLTEGHLYKRCNAYNKGLPTATSSVTSSSAITVKAGQVYDGPWW